MDGALPEAVAWNWQLHVEPSPAYAAFPWYQTTRVAWISRCLPNQEPFAAQSCCPVSAPRTFSRAELKSLLGPRSSQKSFPRRSSHQSGRGSCSRSETHRFENPRIVRPSGSVAKSIRYFEKLEDQRPTSIEIFAVDCRFRGLPPHERNGCLCRGLAIGGRAELLEATRACGVRRHVNRLRHIHSFHGHCLTTELRPRRSEQRGGAEFEFVLSPCQPMVCRGLRPRWQR